MGDFGEKKKGGGETRNVPPLHKKNLKSPLFFFFRKFEGKNKPQKTSLIVLY